MLALNPWSHQSHHNILHSSGTFIVVSLNLLTLEKPQWSAECQLPRYTARSVDTTLPSMVEKSNSVDGLAVVIA